MAEPVVTVARVGDRLVHRFQVVRERGDGEPGRDWVVVDIDERAVTLASPDFEWTRTVDLAAFAEGYEPLSAGAVPVWGY